MTRIYRHETQFPLPKKYRGGVVVECSMGPILTDSLSLSCSLPE